jgi:hypothetical protein
MSSSVEDLLFDNLGRLLRYKNNGISEENFENLSNVVTTLTEDSPKIIELPQTTVTLYEHQKTLIYKCLDSEKSVTEGVKTKQLMYTTDQVSKKVRIIEVPNDTGSLFYNFSVICDGVGSGKSFVVLALIALKPVIAPYNYFMGSQIENLYYNREYYFKNKYVHLKSNLLVVTHGTIGQWKGYLKQFPTIRAVIIENHKSIDKTVGNNELRKKFWNDLIRGNIDCILISDTFYMKFFLRFLVYRYKKTIKFYCDNNWANEKYAVAPELLSEYKKNNNTLPDDPVTFEPHLLKKYNEEDFTSGDDDNYIVEYISQKLNKPTIKDEFDSMYKSYRVDQRSAVLLIKKYLCFSRIIIDEVDSIKINRDTPTFGGLFTWFISSSIGNLLFPRYGHKQNGFSGFISTLSPYCKLMTSINSLPHAKEVFVKNDDEYVKQGINLPPIIHSTIYCKSVANVVGILGNDKSMNTIISMLIADDYDGISEHFQCAVKTPLEVMEVYKKDLGTQIDNKQKEYTYVSSKTYSTQKAKDDAVEKVSKELNSMKTRLASLIENITSINDDNSCAICYEAISKPILFPCCGHVFCSQCIFDSLKMGLKKCAYCNSPLEMDKVVLLTEKDHNTKNKNKEDQVRTRLDACINKITSILETNPDAKILLFSEFDGTFSKVNNKLKELKIVYEHLQGSSNHIAAMLKRLSSGDTKVLLLNSRLFGAGLNISQASDLIIYHKMSDTLRVQIIGRSHRMGRVGSLNVHQILSEDEK